MSIGTKGGQFNPSPVLSMLRAKAYPLDALHHPSLVAFYTCYIILFLPSLPNYPIFTYLISEVLYLVQTKLK